MTPPDDLRKTEYQELLLAVRRSIRYHRRRESFLDRVHQMSAVLTVLFGAATVAALLADLPARWTWVRLLAASLTAIAGATELVFGPANVAGRHGSLAVRFLFLEKDLLRAGSSLSRETLVDLQSRRLDIGAAEPLVDLDMSTVGVKAFVVATTHSVAAGLILALLFFSWREIVFPVPTVGGPWYCLTKTETTDTQPYRKLEVGWRVILSQNDRGIAGSSEKVWTLYQGYFSGIEIDRGDVVGFLQYNYLATTRLSLHHDIASQITRNSTLFLDLRVPSRSNEKLRGNFYWTAANQRGEVACSRRQIDWENEKDRGLLLAP